MQLLDQTCKWKIAPHVGAWGAWAFAHHRF